MSECSSLHTHSPRKKSQNTMKPMVVPKAATAGIGLMAVAKKAMPLVHDVTSIACELLA